MNECLKEITTLCEIIKPLSSHIARHTFATTKTLQNGLPIESVSKMLGHTSFRTTQIYEKVLDVKVSADITELKKKIGCLVKTLRIPSSLIKVVALGLPTDLKSSIKLKVVISPLLLNLSTALYCLPLFCHCSGMNALGKIILLSTNINPIEAILPFKFKSESLSNIVTKDVPLPSFVFACNT
jgi:hypothetical protein